MGNLMTVIITFKNEGDEVAKTCKSTRDTAGDKVDIIVLNDNSDDDFDYVTSIEPYNVKYIKTDERLGTSGGREKALKYCTTPYFIILDGHCRFETEDWYDKAIEVMEKNEDCIYCCACRFFNDDEIYKTTGYGAYYNYQVEKSKLNCVWNVKKISETEFEIPCILGANYMCSMRWWNYIKGLQGLKLYGRDEPYISRKSIMMGGKVKCIPQITTLHKHRKDGKFPYKTTGYETLYNDFAMIYLLYPEIYPYIENFLNKIYNKTQINYIKNLIKSNIPELISLMNYIQENKKFTFIDVDNYNNEFLKTKLNKIIDNNEIYKII